MRKIELLSPARDTECGRAAVDCGADALYVGAPRFGARRSAGNSVEDIAELVSYARPFGVRVYAALNTLVYEDELRDAERLARELIEAGVDALIIQDTAFLRMNLPPVEFHASTQMCNTSPGHVRFLEAAGFSRVILERGLTLGEIRDIRSHTGVELECFVHGAICIAHSGRCYMSRSMGPRSGNRGDCSQPCRLQYDLVDGQGQTLARGKHLLSVKDLDLSARIGEMLDAGVDSFKIEGRLKDISYVKNITLHYRRLLDAAIAAREGMTRASDGAVAAGFEPDPRRTFSRSATEWMYGGKSAGSASFDTPKAAGACVGTVAEVKGNGFRLTATQAHPEGGATPRRGVKNGAGGNRRPPGGDALTLAPGDGICFMAEGELCGTSINGVEGGFAIPNRMDGIRPGVVIYRNHDHRFESLVTGSGVRRAISVRARLEFGLGGVELTLTDACGNETKVRCEGAWEPAREPERMEQSARRQIERGGDTIFDIRVGEVACDGPMPFVPLSALNSLRRQGAEALLAARRRKAEAERAARTLAEEDVAYPYNSSAAGPEVNIVNSLARGFYADHGAREIAPGADTGDIPDGAAVMVTPYCLRRELNRCLRLVGGDSGPLYIVRGRMRYRLDFDCEKCMMRVIKIGYDI